MSLMLPKPPAGKVWHMSLIDKKPEDRWRYETAATGLTSDGEPVTIQCETKDEVVAVVIALGWVKVLVPEQLSLPGLMS